MSRIGLTSAFQLVPEGKHIFQITKVTYDEQFGRMTIRLKTASGMSHEEKFQLLTGDNEINEKAMNAFSYFAKTATHNYENREIDTDELEGCYIGAEATHTSLQSRTNPDKTVTFCNLHDYFEANGFEGAEAEAPAPTAGGSLLSKLGL